MTSEEKYAIEGGSRDKEIDHQMFLRMQRLIVDGRMFLIPRLSRDDILAQANVPKNRFAPIFLKYTGKTFTQYINSLRLNYAAQLIREHPAYNFSAIAKECGMPKMQTFYRLFLLHFGITPGQYRERMKDNTCPDPHEGRAY